MMMLCRIDYQVATVFSRCNSPLPAGPHSFTMQGLAAPRFCILLGMQAVVGPQLCISSECTAPPRHASASHQNAPPGSPVRILPKLQACSVCMSSECNALVACISPECPFCTPTPLHLTQNAWFAVCILQKCSDSRSFRSAYGWNASLKSANLLPCVRAFHTNADAAENAAQQFNRGTQYSKLIRLLLIGSILPSIAKCISCQRPHMRHHGGPSCC